MDHHTVSKDADVLMSFNEEEEHSQLPSANVANFASYYVGYVYDAAMMAHTDLSVEEDASDDERHPEQPGRLSSIYDTLRNAKCLSKMKRLGIRRALQHEILLVHSEDLWDKVIAIESMSEQDIADSRTYYDGLSLYVCQQTTYAALLSCGGVIEACLSVAKGVVQKSFAIVRPPGHHAEPGEHMGFCFFNNVAVAARVVQQMTSIRKILIVDWDVHHGNGTQHAFNDDPSVLYISLHRYDDGTFYPSGPFGNLNSCGDGDGRGYSVNIPWPKAGMGDADYLHAFQTIVMPIAMEFAPELVIISSGFDAADGDELGLCKVTPSGYAHMTHMLQGLAGGRIAVALEGGYNLEAISNSALAVARTLLGEAPPRLEPMTASAVGTETVYQVARFQSQFWKCLNHGHLEPKEDIQQIALSIPEILMAYRQYYLATQKSMYRVPLQPDISNVLNGEVWATSDIWRNKRMVIMVHEFGELRGELASALTCDLNAEKTYLVDFTRELLEWVIQEKISLVDINLLEKPIVRNNKPPPSRDELERNLVTYIWDNYIHLSDAEEIVFIGHGTGCAPIIELLAKRAVSLMKQVQMIIQVSPRSTIPRAPMEPPKIRRWYLEHSLVFVPANHVVLVSDKLKPSHGKIQAINEDKPIKLMINALPMIKEAVRTTFGLEDTS